LNCSCNYVHKKRNKVKQAKAHYCIDLLDALKLHLPALFKKLQAKNYSPHHEITKPECEIAKDGEWNKVEADGLKISLS